MFNQIDQLIEITGNQISYEDAKKYLTWSKGNLEQAVNYYFRNQEKKQDKTPIPIRNNAFDELKQGAQKQKQLQIMIKNLKEEYDKPIEEQLKLNIPDLNSLQQSKINYFENDQIAKGEQIQIKPPQIPELSKLSDREKQYHQYQKQTNQNDKQIKKKEEINIESKKEKLILIQKKKSDFEFQIKEEQSLEPKILNNQQVLNNRLEKIKLFEGQNISNQISGKKISIEEQIQDQVNYPVQLGDCIVIGDIIGKQNLNYLNINDELILNLEIQKQFIEKKPKNSKMIQSDFKPIIRIITSKCEVIKFLIQYYIRLEDFRIIMKNYLVY